MAIQYQILENATPPVKQAKVKEPKQPRDKYGFANIPVGGAAKYEGEGVSRKAVYAAAYQYRKKNPGVTLQVEEIEGAVFVYRLADEGNGGAPAVDDASHYAVAAE